MLYIFDKDSTLVAAKSGARFINQPEDQILIPGTAELLQRLESEGATISIASNQAGIAAGHKSLEDVFTEFRVCLKLCPQVTDAYFCPDFKGEVCWRVWGDCDESHRIEYNSDWLVVQEVGAVRQFRKPDPGMLKLIIYQDLTPNEIMFVGDRPEDEAAAAAANIPFQWVWDVNPEYPQELRGR